MIRRQNTTGRSATSFQYVDNQRGGTPPQTALDSLTEKKSIPPSPANAYRPRPAFGAKHDDLTSGISYERSIGGLSEVQPAETDTREEAIAWFGRTLVRVGVRIPWGRPHRGRFAKVKVGSSILEVGCA